jgi:hypothetical protein
VTGRQVRVWPQLCVHLERVPAWVRVEAGVQGFGRLVLLYLRLILYNTVITSALGVKRGTCGREYDNAIEYAHTRLR